MSAVRRARVAAILVVAVAFVGCDEPRGASPPMPAAPPDSRTEVAAAPGEVDWDSIPLSRIPPNPFGSVETWQLFLRALKTPESPITVCSAGWRPPPGFATMELETELRVRVVDRFLVVEDMVVLGGNLGDPEFEACLVQHYRGRRAAAQAVEPDRAFRIAWNIRKYLE